jgi:predicted DNA-binding protein
MSATRTQIYLTDEQRRRVDALAETEGVTMAEIVRRALDAYLEDEHPDPRAALAATYGADPALVAPSRDEWSRG